MEKSTNAYEVHGRVTGRGGKGIENAAVVVWWQHIRKRVKLAASRTGEGGRYRARYKVRKHPHAKFLIVVEARAKGLKAPLESPLTEAQPDLELDLAAEVVDASEWQTLVRAIRPLLDGLELTDLVESDQHKDLAFLGRELNRPAEQIMRLVVSARLHAAHDLPVPAALLCVPSSAGAGRNAQPVAGGQPGLQSDRSARAQDCVSDLCTICGPANAHAAGGGSAAASSGRTSPRRSPIWSIASSRRCAPSTS